MQTVLAFSLILSILPALGCGLAADCKATAPVDRLNVVGPMIGKAPIWLVEDGLSNRWEAGLVKSLWVLSRKSGGSLQIRSRRLDGRGTIRFQKDLDHEPTDVLVIADPWRRSVIPGGATPDVIKSYAFIPTFLTYPGPGCWELTARLGATEVRIVRDLKR